MLEDTAFGKHLVSLSRAVNSYFEMKSFFACSAAYFIAIWLLSQTETALKVSSLVIPDSRTAFTPQDLERYVASLGTDSAFYIAHLGLETIVWFAASVLASFTISFFAFNLVRAEAMIDKTLFEIAAKTKQPYKPYKYPFRVSTMNVLPLVCFLIESLENTLISVYIAFPTPFTLTIASFITAYKWKAVSISFSCTVISFLIGWIRVAYLRIQNGIPLIASESTDTAKTKRQPPPGLSKAGDIGKTTYKGESKKSK